MTHEARIWTDGEAERRFWALMAERDRIEDRMPRRHGLLTALRRTLGGTARQAGARALEIEREAEALVARYTTEPGGARQARPAQSPRLAILAAATLANDRPAREGEERRGTGG